MQRIRVKGVNYALSLYFSYLLPLFDVKVVGNSLLFTKIYGVCRGLRCEWKGSVAECAVPGNCSEESYSEILGLRSRAVVEKFYDTVGATSSGIPRIVIMHSSLDKLLVFTAAFLSRNTDYYRNTVKWVKLMAVSGCFQEPGKCADKIKSYQYAQLVENYAELRRIMESGLKAFQEALELLTLKNTGLKTVNAYLLHSYGFTQYAPIDRYYESLLRELGITGTLPSKELCLKYKLDCSSCYYRRKCIYFKTRELFGSFNGVVQSLTYIYGRLLNILEGRVKPGVFEEELLKAMRVEDAVYKLKLLVNYVKTHYTARGM